MTDQSEQPLLTNIDPNKVAEALAMLAVDMQTVGRAMQGVKKARKAMKDHASYYEEQHGIDAEAIRERYKEMNMTARERERKYVVEQITRRAVNLWEAESPEDFEELMASAAAVAAASGESYDRLLGARARADGFNSGLNGGTALTDNPHTPGSLEHQEWAIGCADALGEEALDSLDQEEVQPAPQKRGRGRPRKQVASNGAAAEQTDEVRAR
jgi:hypothetical protein